MFVWMRQFKNEYSDMTEEEVEKYLTDQLRKIEKVRKDIDDCMHEADSLLSRY
jgi:uncharacterized protein Yka (UPF0111/DUF47 family)